MAIAWRWRWLAFLVGALPSAYTALETLDCVPEQGVVTAPLCRMQDIGWFLLTIAVLGSWWRLRLATVASIVGALLCLPIYINQVAPGLYDWTGIPRCCSTDFWGFYPNGIGEVLVSALTLGVSGLVLALPSRRRVLR